MARPHSSVRREWSPTRHVTRHCARPASGRGSSTRPGTRSSPSRSAAGVSRSGSRSTAAHRSRCSTSTMAGGWTTTRGSSICSHCRAQHRVPAAPKPGRKPGPFRAAIVRPRFHERRGGDSNSGWAPGVRRGASRGNRWETRRPAWKAGRPAVAGSGPKVTFFGLKRCTESAQRPGTQAVRSV